MGVFRKRLIDTTELVTFHDVVMLPGWSDVEPSSVVVSSRVSKEIDVAIPFVSSPMESVTGPKLASALARSGGLGFLHRNCSVDSQVKMAQEVKSETVDLKQVPHATVDEKGCLRVGAAVGPHDIERVRALTKLVDVFVIDVAHFHTHSCFTGAKQILRMSSVDVIIGNIGTFSAAEDAISQLEDIAGLRCGIGSGSTCITPLQTRISAPTLFAVASAADAARILGADLPIIADGGVRNTGDAALALAAGAWVVMLGNILTATEESPSPVKEYEGEIFKVHWGMGSQRAREQSFALDRYSQSSNIFSEEIEGLVPVSGSVDQVTTEFRLALQASCGYIGANNIPEMWERARFARVSYAGGQEIGPHSLIRTDFSKEGKK